MSRPVIRSLSKDWDSLTLQLEKRKARPSQVPSVLPLKLIKLWLGVFQHRGRRGHDGEAHVRELAAAVKKSSTRTLDAVTVWWDGKGWACIDGHHRLDAYRAAAVGLDHLVPVQVFEGSLEAAIERAATANTKDKLAMSSAAKSNTAWRLVSTTGLSKAATANASGVGESTVAAMRRVFALLSDRAKPVDEFSLSTGEDLRDLTWMGARGLAAGREPPDFDREEANEEKAQEMALALRKALGKEGGKYPEILARALEIYDSRLLQRLAELWDTQVDDKEAADTAAALP